MQVTEKHINNRNVRIVYFTLNKNYSLYYMLEGIKKMNIYFDYIMVSPKSSYPKRLNPTLYRKNLKKVDIEKYVGTGSSYASADYIILNYEKHPDYITDLRQDKLERILL